MIKPCSFHPLILLLSNTLLIKPCVSFYNIKYIDYYYSYSYTAFPSTIVEEQPILPSSSVFAIDTYLDCNSKIHQPVNNNNVCHIYARKRRQVLLGSYNNNNNDGAYRRRRHQRRNSTPNRIISFMKKIPRDIFFPSKDNKWNNIQTILIYILTILYLYQILSAVQFLPKLQQILLDSGSTRFSNTEVPSSIRDIIKMNLIGEKAIIFSPSSSSVALARVRDFRLKNAMSKYIRRSPILVSTMGPFTMDYIYQAYISKIQIHRYLTCGFIHSSIFHLFFNLYSLSNIPSWLSIISWNFYFSTFLLSTIGGSIAHSYQSSTSFVLGASSGICGLYGAMFILLRKMKRSKKSNALFKQMLIMIFIGCTNVRISNASHIGGFISGCIMAILFGDNFRKSYVMRKKVWFIDDVNERVRKVIGPDLTLSPPFLSLKYFWIVVLLFAVLNDVGKNAIVLMGRGFLHPGLISGVA